VIGGGAAGPMAAVYLGREPDGDDGQALAFDVLYRPLGLVHASQPAAGAGSARMAPGRFAS